MRKPYDSAEIGDEIIEGESPMDWHVYWRESGRYAGDLLSPEDIQRKVSYQLRRKVSVSDAKLHLANEFARRTEEASRAQMEQAKADALREHQKAVRDARSNPSGYAMPDTVTIHSGYIESGGKSGIMRRE